MVKELLYVVALVAGMLLSGCVEDVRYNPSGCDVHIRGRWQIDGQDPDVDTCGDIALVELAIFNDPETQFWSAPELTLRCEAENDANAVLIDGGAYLDTAIVTRNRCGGSGEILETPLTGEYKSRWRGTTDLKFVVDCTPIVSTAVSMADGGMVLDLGTINLRTQDGGIECPPDP